MDLKKLMLTQLLHFFRGGSPDFNEAEKRLLSALAEALPEQEKEIFLRQLASRPMSISLD